MKHHFGYLVTDLTNGFQYKGIHSTDDLNDSYLGSGVEILEAVESKGYQCFTREVIFTASSREDLLRWESEAVDYDWVSRNDTYNQVLGGQISPDNTGCTLITSPNRKKIRFVLPQRVTEFLKQGWTLGGLPENHTFYGKKAVHDPTTKERRYVSPEEVEEYLIKGWKLGDAHKAIKDRVLVYHPATMKQKMVLPDKLKEFLDQGWIQGMSPKVRSDWAQTSGTYWLNKNGTEVLAKSMEELETKIAEGYLRGRAPMKESTREKHRNQVLSEITKGKIGQKSKKRWDNPEYRIRMSGENCLVSGTKWMHHPTILKSKRVPDGEVANFQQSGYLLGRLNYSGRRV